MRNRLVGSRQSIVNRNTVANNSLKSFFKVSGLNWGRKASAKLILLIVSVITAPSFLLAQGDTIQPHTVDMATAMRSNGKIYVVVTVLIIILLGLFFYLIRLDRKIGKLEKEQ